MSATNWLISGVLLLVVVIRLVVFFRTPPTMRTADEKQIERETAAIQRNESAYDFIDELLGLVRRFAWWLFAGCSTVTALIFFASTTI